MRSLRSLRLQDLGPMVRVQFTVGDELQQLRAESGGRAAECLDLMALVDTGASVTFLPPGSFERLGVQPTNETWIRSAGDRRRSHPSCTGKLRFLGAVGETSVPTRAVEVPGLGHVGAIIGRDTLAHGRLLYDGQAGLCTMVLRGTEVELIDPARVEPPVA